MGGYSESPLRLSQRALAARRAISERCSGVNAFLRAFPPFLPPLRPMTMAGLSMFSATTVATMRASLGQRRRAMSSSDAPSSMPSRREPISSAKTSGPVDSSVASRIAAKAVSFSSLLERLGMEYDSRTRRRAQDSLERLKSDKCIFSQGKGIGTIFLLDSEHEFGQSSFAYPPCSFVSRVRTRPPQGVSGFCFFVGGSSRKGGSRR